MTTQNTNTHSPSAIQEASQIAAESAMSRLTALLCSEVQAGTPEHNALTKEVESTFTDFAIENVVNEEPKPRRPGM